MNMTTALRALAIPSGWASYFDMSKGIIIYFDPTKQDLAEIIALTGGSKEVLEVSGNSSVNPVQSAQQSFEGM